MFINTEKFVLLSFVGFIIVAFSFNGLENDLQLHSNENDINKINSVVQSEIDTTSKIEIEINPLSYDTSNLFSRCWYNNRTFAYMKERKNGFHDSTILNLLDKDSSWCFPINQKIISKFGYRGSHHFHKGLDVKLKIGQEVRSLFSGKVRYAQYNRGGYGNLVIIRHFNGTETYYAHLSKLKVSPNDMIKAGDVIGLGGNTGSSAGPHLHFEVRIEDNPINPEVLFNLNEHSLVVSEIELSKDIFSPKGKRSSVSNHTHFANSEKCAIVKKDTINENKSTSQIATNKPISKIDPIVKKNVGKSILKPNIEKIAKSNLKQKNENHLIQNNTTSPNKTKALYHIIKKGDCIFNLSRRYNVSVNSLYKLNRLNERSILNIDQKIRIK